jgi:hypothetical protein
MKRALCFKAFCALATFVLLSFTNMIPSAAGADPMYRWDTISVTMPGGVLTLNPGGSDYALAADLTTIQISGHGTFGGGVPPTGGGFWATAGPSAGPSGTASGTFKVVSLVRFTVAPGPLPPGAVDNIAPAASVRGGLAILGIRYSDGSSGVLAVSCHLPVGAPSGIFEGITATKGYVDFWDRVPPVPGVNANRTNFHVLP